MSDELLSILVLIGIFLIGTVLSVNLGVLGIVAAFAVGTALGVSEDDIFGGFPGDLFVILVGVTYLFAIASKNGTVNWLIHAAVRAVGGRTAAIPWVMFLVTAAPLQERSCRGPSRSSRRSGSGSRSSTESTPC